MIVGVLELEISFPGNRSLKGKRQVLRSLKERVSHRFNVSIAEVDGNDLWQRATVGVACVSNDSRHAEETLQKIADFVASAGAGRCEILDHTIEILYP